MKVMDTCTVCTYFLHLLIESRAHVSIFTLFSVIHHRIIIKHNVLIVICHDSLS